MGRFVRLDDHSVVAEVLEADTLPEFHPDLMWIEVTGQMPSPDVGWTYGNGMFGPPPPASISVLRSAKQAEIRAGYDTALAGVLAGADATTTGVAVGSALMAATDPEGLEYLVDMLTARRVALEQALLAAQADADPVAAVQAIVVSYPT